MVEIAQPVLLETGTISNKLFLHYLNGIGRLKLEVLKHSFNLFCYHLGFPSSIFVMVGKLIGHEKGGAHYRSSFFYRTTPR